jgi:hypothetical protein
MDERAMMNADVVPLYLILPASFATGLVLGYFYFRALHITATLIVSGGQSLHGAALTIGRLVVLGAVFYLAALAGAPALLAVLTGVLAARQWMLHNLRKVSA